MTDPIQLMISIARYRWGEERTWNERLRDKWVIVTKDHPVGDYPRQANPGNAKGKRYQIERVLLGASEGPNEGIAVLKLHGVATWVEAFKVEILPENCADTNA